MSRGITLRGAAAGAFVEAMMGKRPRSDDDKYMRIATFIHMGMKRNNKDGEDKARRIVECLTKEGLDKTLEIITGVKSEGAPSTPASEPRRLAPPRKKQ